MDARADDGKANEACKHSGCGVAMCRAALITLSAGYIFKWLRRAEESTEKPVEGTLGNQTGADEGSRSQQNAPEGRRAGWKHLAKSLPPLWGILLLLAVALFGWAYSILPPKEARIL